MRAFIKYLAIGSLVVSQAVNAADINYHGYSQSTKNETPTLSSSPIKPKIFGNCYIDVVNDSFSNVTLYGRFDDGVPLVPFDVYSYEYSHLIDMFYNDYCHSGMYISVITFSGYTIFSGYVFTGSTVHIVPVMHGKKISVKLEKHQPAKE